MMMSSKDGEGNIPSELSTGGGDRISQKKPKDGYKAETALEPFEEGSCPENRQVETAGDVARRRPQGDPLLQ